MENGRIRALSVRFRARGGTAAVFVAMWVLGVGALATVLVLRDREDASEHGPIVVAQLRQQIAQISGLPFEAAPGHGSTPRQIRARLGEEEMLFKESLSDLAQLHAGHSTPFADLGEAYFSTIWRMLALVESGRVEQAGIVIGRADQPGGITWKFREGLAVEESTLAHRAERERMLAMVGTAVAVLLTLVAFSIALFRATRSRRDAERLADVNHGLLELSRRDEERYRDLFENANEPIATVDLDWILTDVNSAFVQALGFSRDELLGSDLSEYLTKEGRALSALHRDRKLNMNQPASTYEQTFIAKGGRRVVFEVSTRLIAENGQPIGIQGMCRDVTARKEAEGELRMLAELNSYQAHHDALTGLPNRLQFHDEIERAIVAAKRRGPFAVALIDLDRFKEINDSLGHGAGDRLLEELSTELQAIVRAPDTVARLGGDEFGVLLHGLADSQGGWADSVERIKAALERPVLVDGIPVNVEASIGIAIHPTHGDGVDALLQRAEVAMYVAKTTGRGHAVYTPRQDPNDPSKLALLGELRRGLSQRELMLCYQPILDQREDGGAQAEALLRWRHPTHGLIPPGEFLPLVEQTGLMKPLTLYVLEEAVRQCKQWEQDGHVVTVSINLSTRNLSEPDLVDNVLRILADWSLDPSRIILEITESAVIADPVGTRHALEGLSDHGIRLAIDDFGAGFTSLSHLAHLPIDVIKIDRSFIAGLPADHHDRAIVRSIINLSHDLGLEVVAEGVETKESLDELRELGCDLVQGFYLARPLDPDELVAWLEDKTRDARVVRAA